jgi:tetraacyldisaccharide 4'-kinase
VRCRGNALLVSERSHLRSGSASNNPAGFWIDVLSGKRRGPAYSALRGALSGFACGYAVGLEAYLAAENMGVRSRTRLPVPVISIGNLSSGGTGKTPMTQLIAAYLDKDGFRPAILSRGHGGALSHGPVQVSDTDGNVLRTADEVGDEAVALAHRSPGVPVFVGKDRRKSAALAFTNSSTGVFLLDDGFQYWQLARDLDIVLVDSRRPFDNGYVLPRGLLREPKWHLRRAGMVIVTRADLATERELESTIKQVERLAPKAPLFLAHHRFGGFRPLNDAAESKLPGRALAVCGIAQPDAFLSLLRLAQVPLTNQMVALTDHAVYDAETVAAIKGKIRDQGADSLVTTEKDAVKLAAFSFEVPAYATKLEIEIDRPDEFWAELMQRANLVTTTGSRTI